MAGEPMAYTAEEIEALVDARAKELLTKAFTIAEPPHRSKMTPQQKAEFVGLHGVEKFTQLPE